MTTFKPGDCVITKESYFKRFGRRVRGTVVENPSLPSDGTVVLVRWDRQEGKLIPDHQDQIVIMLTADLELAT